ncbi:unnamed protein product, partial [Timema podura]|nr:unnamed protein product [Timema podura]
MALPQTSPNKLKHVLQAHLQVILWKACNQNTPSYESGDITQFEWNLKEGITTPVTANVDTAPPELIDILKCQCKAQGKIVKSVAANEGCSAGGVDQDKSEDIYQDDDVDYHEDCNQNESVDSDKLDDEWHLCEDQSRPAPTEKWCYVDCPVDCEVTRWTLWNTSECLCGNTASTMMRYRYIVTNPSEKGRPCPLPLIQHKPCPAVPCYTWDRGDWDTCSLH